MWTRLQQPMGRSFKEAAGIRHSLLFYFLIPGTTWIIYLLRQLIKGPTTLPPSSPCPSSPISVKLQIILTMMISYKDKENKQLQSYCTWPTHSQYPSKQWSQPSAPQSLTSTMVQTFPSQTTKPFKPMETNIVQTEYVLGINKWAITKLRWSPCSLYLSLS